MFHIKEIRAVDIIVLPNTSLESIAIRGVLESLSIQTRVHYIGNAAHLISLLQSSDYLHNIVVISCHGNKAGLFLPELAKEIEIKMPYTKQLSANNFIEFLQLNKQIVINTGCCLGSKEFANSFLLNGASAYIGLTNYAEGSSCLLFIINFLYLYLVKNYSINIAYEKTLFLEEETKIFKLWQKSNVIS